MAGREPACEVASKQGVFATRRQEREVRRNGDKVREGVHLEEDGWRCLQRHAKTRRGCLVLLACTLTWERKETGRCREHHEQLSWLDEAHPQLWHQEKDIWPCVVAVEILLRVRPLYGCEDKERIFGNTYTIYKRQIRL